MMKLSLFFLGITCLTILIPSSQAQNCHSASGYRRVHRVVHPYVEEIHHDKHYVPVAFVDLVQTFFSLPQVQFIPQGQVQIPQQQATQPLSLPSPPENTIAQSSGLPPMASYGEQSLAGGNNSNPSVTGRPSTLQDLLKTSCASCHSGPSAKGSFSLFDPAGNLNPQADLAEAWVRIKRNEMPPGRPLDEPTKSQLRSLILK